MVLPSSRKKEKRVRPLSFGTKTKNSPRKIIDIRNEPNARSSNKPNPTKDKN